MFLRPFGVCASLRSTARYLAEKIERAAWRNVRYTHMLRTECDKVVNGRIVITFHVAPQKLTPLRKTDGIEPSTKLMDGRELLGNEVYLGIDIAIEGGTFVFFDVSIDVNRMDEDARMEFLHLAFKLDYSTRGVGVTTVRGT